MFVTSAAKVLSPSDSDFIDSILDCLARESQLALVQTVISRKFNHRLDPELRLPAFALHVDVHAGLFTGEE
jgi:hypothetical protein